MDSSFWGALIGSFTGSLLGGAAGRFMAIRRYRNSYDIPDPLLTRLRQWFMRTFVCSLKGHWRAQKMYGPGPCRRCQ